MKTATMAPHLAAAFCIGLGGTVLIGWAYDIGALRTVLPGLGSMKANTALGFVGCGIALLALATGRARWPGALAAAGAFAIGLATLSEYGFVIDLGIDQWLVQDADTPARFQPGRMAPVACVGFIAASLGLLLGFAAGRLPKLKIVAQALALTTLILGALGLVGYLLNLSLLSSNLPYQTLALHSAVGFAVLGAGLSIGLQPRAPRGADQRIGGLAALLLVVAAGTTGLVSFATIGRQIQTTLAQGLTTALDARIREITINVELSAVSARIVGSQADLLRPLRALTADPTAAHSVEAVRAELAGVLHHGFSGSAVTLPAGAEVARAGVFVTSPVPAAGETRKAVLVWRDGIHLRNRVPLADAAGPLGTLIVEQARPDLTALLRTAVPWASAEFFLCTKTRAEVSCLPMLHASAAFVLPPRQTHELSRALANNTRFLATIDHSGVPVLVAIGHLDALGSLLVLKVDAAEIYTPAARSFSIAALLTLLFASAGALLVQQRVRPIAARLMQAEAQTRSHYQALQASAALMHSVFADSPDAILVVDGDGHIVEASPRTEVLFGYASAALLGQPIEILLPERYRATHPGHRAHFNAAPHARPMGSGLPLYARRADGSEFPVDVVLSPLQDGTVGRTIAIVRDITERKQVEEALRRSNQELEEFAYVASHDLKEPLRGIHNYAQFLLEDYAERLDGAGQERLHAMKRLTERMESQIDALLQFSRTGQVELALAATDLSAVLAEVLDSLGAALAERGVEVRVPVPLPVVRCDRVRVGQVLHNLIGNAIKYHDHDQNKDRKWVEIGWRTGAAELIFHVRDNGIGIPAKHQQAIFRIFKRLHGRDKYGGGSGIGLSLVKKIVERHGGRIWVESEPGIGSTFYFTLQAPSA